MVTFGSLKIGERFHYGVDADGYEPYMYKLSEEEAYVESGSGAGLREIIKPDTQVVVWGEPVTLHDHPTEVERAAFSVMLVSGKPLSDHPGLTNWILALARDTDERRELDEFILEADTTIGYADSEETALPKRPLRDVCEEAGFITPKRRWDRENSAFKAICNYKPKGKGVETVEEERWREYERAALLLGHAIVRYREAGRPDGDQTQTVTGMGSPLLSITTSLAAAIAEYHVAIINVWANETQRLEMELHTVTPADLITQGQAAVIANVTPQAVSNAIAYGRLRAYANVGRAHRPGDRRVSEAEVRQLWPARE